MGATTVKPVSVSEEPIAAVPPVRAPDGTRLTAWDLGGVGPPLVMLHATGFHGRCYAPLAAALATDFHCYALDLRGHGSSDLSASGTYEWARFREDLVAMMDQLRLHQPLAFGHSLGGCVALLAEEERPGTFSGIFAYEPIVFTVEHLQAAGRNRNMVGLTLRRRVRFGSKGEALFNYAAKPPFDRFRADALWRYVDGAFDVQADGTATLHCPPEHEAQIYEQAALSGAFDRLGEVRAPVALAYGAVNPDLGAAQHTRIASRLADATVEEVPGLGHFGPFEEPDAVAARVAASLLGSGQAFQAVRPEEVPVKVTPPD